MIHTIELFSRLNSNEIKYIIDKFDIKNKNYFNFSQYHTVSGVKVEIKNIKTKLGDSWGLYVFVDVIKLLGRAVIKETDRDKVIEDINEIIYSIFSYTPQLLLRRIDFRFDAVICDEKKRNLLIKLYNKCENKKGYMEKVEVYNRETRRSNKYSSLRYKNKSKVCNIYDKEMERVAKYKSIMNYEKDVLRFEAQVKLRHIKYMKSHYNVEDSLEVYFSNALYNVFMSKIVIKAIGISDYYNEYYARKIINSSKLKNKEKEELKEFIKTINGKNKFSDGKKLYSSYKYKKFIGQLENLNINPILIPKNSGYSKIENPIRGILL